MNMNNVSKDNKRSTRSITHSKKTNNTNTKPKTKSINKKKNYNQNTNTNNTNTEHQQPEFPPLSLSEENTILKNKVNHLEKYIKTLTNKISAEEYNGNINTNPNNTNNPNSPNIIDQNLLIEIEIWKNRSESIAKSYLDNMSGLKDQLNKSKINFTNEIKIIKQQTNNEVENIQNKYVGMLDKYENNIRKMRKDNDDLKKKIDRVQSIIKIEK